MLLTFDEWWSIWEESGHWTERGTHLGQYFMKRHSFLGCYEVDNVHIMCRTPRNIRVGRGRPGFKVMVKCPHCGKVGNVAVMKRWHFDNCVNL